MTKISRAPTCVDLVCDGSSGSPELEREWAYVAKEIFEVFKSKQRDYGPNNIALLQDGGILVRMTDKFMRLDTLYRSGENPNNESVEDTWTDIADYAVIALMCLRGHWPPKTIKEVLNEQPSDTKV